MRELPILGGAAMRNTIKRISEKDRVSTPAKKSTHPQRRRERGSAGLSRDKHNGSIQAAELMAFRVEIFALRNDISRSQAFKEIKAGRLAALKCGSRTLITAQAEKAWQDALPRVLGQQTSSAV